eukprot:gnl/Dysnectes_brevis/2769_a3373_701.p1 GENE.gnl/Dysnectes_brevis/2769_a3373_701~~gnl/Dysnectes_brevis/2769_a3373_701.p1  ORF type:complete len:336 (+),score=52.40 gnl/Dysnectes_brevis/2769_a3373_701:102-1109(+)
MIYLILLLIVVSIVAEYTFPTSVVESSDHSSIIGSPRNDPDSLSVSSELSSVIGAATVDPDDLTVECSYHGIYNSSSLTCSCVYGFEDDTCSTNVLTSSIVTSMTSWAWYSGVMIVFIVSLVVSLSYMDGWSWQEGPDGEEPNLIHMLITFVSAVALASIDVIFSWWMMILGSWSWGPLIHLVISAAVAFTTYFLVSEDTIEYWLCDLNTPVAIPMGYLVYFGSFILLSALDIWIFMMTTSNVINVYRSRWLAMLYWGLWSCCAVVSFAIKAGYLLFWSLVSVGSQMSVHQNIRAAPQEDPVGQPPADSNVVADVTEMTPVVVFSGAINTVEESV